MMDERTFRRLYLKRDVNFRCLAPLPKGVEELVKEHTKPTLDSTQGASRMLIDYGAILAAQSEISREDFLKYAADSYDVYRHISQMTKPEIEIEEKRADVKVGILTLLGHYPKI